LDIRVKAKIQLILVGFLAVIVGTIILGYKQVRLTTTLDVWEEAREFYNPKLAKLVTEKEWAEATTEKVSANCEITIKETIDHCSEVLDCKNETLHPDRCGPGCKYHRMQEAFNILEEKK